MEPLDRRPEAEPPAAGRWRPGDRAWGAAVACRPSLAAGRRGAAPGRTLGDHPADGKPVTLHEGRYGPYVKHGRVNATLPKSMTPEQVALADALPLLEERAVRSGGRKAKARPEKKPAKAKPVPKRAAASRRRKKESDE